MERLFKTNPSGTCRVSLALLTPEMTFTLIGDDPAIVGSVTLIRNFIVFPLDDVLLESCEKEKVGECNPKETEEASG